MLRHNSLIVFISNAISLEKSCNVVQESEVEVVSGVLEQCHYLNDNLLHTILPQQILILAIITYYLPIR